MTSWASGLPKLRHSDGTPADQTALRHRPEGQRCFLRKLGKPVPSHALAKQEASQKSPVSPPGCSRCGQHGAAGTHARLHWNTPGLVQRDRRLGKDPGAPVILCPCILSVGGEGRRANGWILRPSFSVAGGGRPPHYLALIATFQPAPTVGRLTGWELLGVCGAGVMPARQRGLFLVPSPRAGGSGDTSVGTCSRAQPGSKAEAKKATSPCSACSLGSAPTFIFTRRKIETQTQLSASQEGCVCPPT